MLKHSNVTTDSYKNADKKCRFHKPYVGLQTPNFFPKN